MLNRKEIRVYLNTILKATFAISSVILILVIYIWTMIIAYDFNGFRGIVVVLIFPVGAQILYAIDIWKDTGTFLNHYCIFLSECMIFWILGAIFLLGKEIRESRNENNS